MGPFVSISQLLDDLTIDLSLGVHETNEVDLSHRWCSKSAGVRNKKQTIADRCGVNRIVDLRRRPVRGCY